MVIQNIHNTNLNNVTLNSKSASISNKNISSATTFSEVLKDAVDSIKPNVSPTTVNLDTIFEKASTTYKVPINLLKAMAKTESNFNPNAISSCGAMGIMQLMPKTAKALGVVNAFDPEQNIMGGASYISQKLKKHNGNIQLALAEYNAGSGNVSKYGGIPPFKETHKYINKVTGYMNQNLVTESVVMPSNIQFPSQSISKANQTAESITLESTTSVSFPESLLPIVVSDSNSEDASLAIARNYISMYQLALQIGKTNSDNLDI